MKKHTAWFRFYEELNDFLPPELQKKIFPYVFSLPTSIKNAIEAIGVPHTEVDLILVNGNSVDFEYLLQPNDRVAVYPTFESLDISPLIRLRPEPLRYPKFILDVHLGKLAHVLRLLGFDTLYQNNFSDKELVHLAEKESRIILTQDLGILKRKSVTRGYWVRARTVEAQVLEVVQRFDLIRQIKPFTRCLVCNGEVVKVAKSAVLDQIPLRIREMFNDFYQCMACKKVYWRGSHYDKMMKRIQKIKEVLKGEGSRETGDRSREGDNG